MIQLSFWGSTVWTLVVMVILMAITWWVAKRINLYSIVDAVWAISFAILAPMIVAHSPGVIEKKMILALMYFAWSIRLGLFLGKRILSHPDQEDGRYLTLSSEYGEKKAQRFFIFYMYQAVSVVFFILPLIIVAQNTDSILHPFEILGVTLFLAGWVGEVISDRQLSHFKRDPSSKGKVCEVGLWKYSRHPNYFFESVLWFGFGVYALGSPYGWIGILPSLGMLGLLLYVTGVPMSESQNLKSKGDLYREYQKKTSIFIPRNPKI